ncbi:MAG TPA: hypothetical protein VFP39_07175 [Gemmatimonadales bacterium]|nr:hypothetical protein [Gemmatimonadales bacterium]
MILVKEKHIVTAFRQAGAVSPTAATTPAAIGVAQRFAFLKLQRRGILKEAGSGRFYLDELSWKRLRGARRRLALLVGLLALALALVPLLRR